MSLFTLFACGNKMENYKTKKIEYDASPSASNGYKCEILSGSYVGDAIIPYVPVAGGWGIGGGAYWSVGEDKHIAPDTVYIRYYSLADDKFYVAKHPLDQQEMYRLLTAEYKDRKGKFLGYSTFGVGVAPCGLVSVWIGGDAGVLEICQFRAQEADLDFPQEYRYVSRIEVSREEFIKDRDYLYPFIQKEIAENRVSSQYWELLTKKYKWKLTFNDPGFEAYNYSVYLINSERRYGASNGNWLVELNEKAIPNELSIFIKHDKDPLRYKVWIEVVKTPKGLDGEERILYRMNRNRELLDLFDQFYAEAAGEEVSLYVKLSKDMQSARLFLKTATREQEIPGCSLYGIFNSDEYDIDR